MASRFSRDDRDPRDDRYTPRDRETPRYGDRRPPSALFASSYSGRADDFGPSSGRDPVPRAPRGAVDSRPPAPLGPRGRGFGPATPRRDFTFGGDRYRDPEFDRRDRRPSPNRVRTPGRDRDDSRDRGDLRDIDTERARLNSRDGPPSAGSTFSDPARTSIATRGGFSRGRGQADRDYWTPGRAFTPDERNAYRPRREGSVDSRGYDRRDDFRDRREDDRKSTRDRDERDDSYFRRDQPRTDVRPGLDLRSSSFAAFNQPAQNDRAPLGRPALSERSSAGDLRNDYDGPRRASTLSDQGLQKDIRREVPKPDVRAEAPRYQARVASPPPSVPQFGSFRAPGKNVWINPATQNKSIPTAPSTATQQAPKAAPTAPKAQLTINPPTAPKADRVLEQSRVGMGPNNVPPGTESSATLFRAAVPLPDQWASRYGKAVSPNPPSTPQAQGREDTSVQARFASRSPVPPTAPRAMTQPHTMLNPKASPALNIAEFAAIRPPQPGQKAAVTPSAPRTSFPDNVPTGPKAERAPWFRNAPNASSVPALSFSQQPNNGPPPPPAETPPPFPVSQPSLVPTKRASTAEEEDVHSRPSTGPAMTFRSGDTGRESKVPRIEGSSSASQAISAGVQDLEPQRAGGVQSRPFPNASASTSAFGLDKKTLAEPGTSSEDEGMFDEDDFTKHEAAYTDKRNRHLQRMSDISSRPFRATTPFQQLSQMFGMRYVSSKVEFKPPPSSTGLAREMPVRGSTENDAALPAMDEYEDNVDMMDYESGSSATSLALSSPEPTLSGKGLPSPLTDPEQYYASRQQDITAQLREKLSMLSAEDINLQRNLQAQYLDLYRVWRANVDEMDRARHQAEKQADKETPKPEEVPIPPEITPIPVMTPTEGGRRAHKFSSQYDMERVLEESKREEEERRRRAAIEEGEANSAEERETDIPAMLDPAEVRKRRLFCDTNRLRDAEDAISIFEFAPPVDTFTQEEDELLRKLYDKNNKAWGQIARAMREQTGGRMTYKECINHYYSTKFDKPYKKPNTGRGKKKAAISRRTARGRVVQSFANLDADMEMGDGDAAVQVTDSGRPRRAAAPKFGPQDADPDSSLGTPIRTIGTPVAENGELVTKTKRQKGTTQRGGRKGRAQPLAARPNLSPTKTDKDKDRMPLAQTEPWPSMDSMDVLSALPPSGSYFDNSPLVYREQPELLSTGAPGPKDRPRALSNQRTGASSYWSVNEENHFRACLAYFGTEDKAFEKIAAHMQTKTTQMVRNHFAKLKQEGKHPAVVEAAEAANIRIQRGENLGPPPVAAVGQRRRQDIPQAGLPRTLAPNTTSQDLIDLEKSPAARPGLPAHTSPPSLSAPSRYGGINHPYPMPSSSQAVQAPGQMPLATSHAPSASASQPQRQQQAGPRLGYFLDRPSGGHRTSLSSREPPHLDIGASRMDPVNLRTIDRIKSEHEPTQRQPTGQMQELPPQLSLHGQRTQEEPVHRITNPIFARHGPASQLSPQGREPQDVFGVDRRFESLFGGSMGRPGPSQPSEALRGLSQHGPPPSAPPPAAAPPKEPSRRVNIMSMLNPEPEEERSRKKDSEPTQLPQQAPARPYSRPSLPTGFPASGSSQSTPVTEISHRDSFSHPSHRDSWPPARQSFAPPAQNPLSAHSNSPHLQQMQPQLGDIRGSLSRNDYRAGHDILGQALRGSLNPTPPPPGSAYHSRTPSLAQPQQQPPPQVHSATQAGQLHRNPFSSIQPPNASTPQQRPIDLQQALQRNESSITHSRYPSGSGPLHSGLDRTFDRQREASMLDRFREAPDPRDVRAESDMQSRLERMQARQREREYIDREQREREQRSAAAVEAERDREAREYVERMRGRFGAYNG